MIEELSIEDKPNYSIEQLYDSPENVALIAEFEASEKGKGLEYYLKEAAERDENMSLSRTYLVKDSVTRELAGYFTLRTGLITIQVKDDSFDSYPAIELSNFAVNVRYKKKHPEVEGLGKYIFRSFVIPLVKKIAKYVGVYSLYIYALPEEKLISHYTTMGFSRLPAAQEKFVQQHVKPKYDEGCIFMYQTI